MPDDNPELAALADGDYEEANNAEALGPRVHFSTSTTTLGSDLQEWIDQEKIRLNVLFRKQPKARDMSSTSGSELLRGAIECSATGLELEVLASLTHRGQYLMDNSHLYYTSKYHRESLELMSRIIDRRSQLRKLAVQLSEDFSRRDEAMTIKMANYVRMYKLLETNTLSSRFESTPHTPNTMWIEPENTLILMKLHQKEMISTLKSSIGEVEEEENRLEDYLDREIERMMKIHKEAARRGGNIIRED
ncbi:hypothetical protein N7456_006574 [Penicillium angulare]|uniref:Uncharacterized protein n=1 Tax=Penicillium angulare TaxID=116970 RepID=A0A9W9FIC0_9EURO|nr:hypothetical protein N7456_006574 [Penicillium angulare]